MKKQRFNGIAPPRSVYNKARTFFKMTKQYAHHQFYVEQFVRAGIDEGIKTQVVVVGEEYSLTFNEIPKETKPSYDQLLKFYLDHAKEVKE